MSENIDQSLKKFYMGFFAVAALLAAVVSFYASSHPDGLEKVAEDNGFLNTAKDSAVANSPLADYSFAGIESARLSVAVAGIVGVIITAAVGILLFKYLKKKS